MASHDIWQQLLHFKREEFGDHADDMQDELLHRLDRARALAGIPFTITSAYREVAAGQPPEHSRGYAVDIRAHDSRTKMHIVRAALEAGFRRVGVESLHIHLGCDPTLPQDVLWIDVSR